MSIVVVVKKAGKIVIAADTLYSFGNTKVSPTYLSKRSKIHHFDNKEEIFETCLKIHPILKDEYFLNPYEEDTTYEPSKIEGLIANPNGIFGIYARREVYEFEKFWAIGSGEEYALGSLFSTYDLIDEPERIAELAVKASCEFDDGCDLPLEIYSVKLSKTVLK